MDAGVVHATFVELSDNPLSPDTSEFVALEKEIMNQQQTEPPVPPLPGDYHRGESEEEDQGGPQNVEDSSLDTTSPPAPPPPPPSSLETSSTPPPPPIPSSQNLPTSGSSSEFEFGFRKTSDMVQREIEAEEQQRIQLQSELEEKLEERKRSLDLNSGDNGLQLMERRQFRQFSRADEYLYAMKEDLAEWMNNLYPHIDMDADNFMNKLETGEHLVQHGNAVRQKWLDLFDLIAEGKTKQRPPNFEVPDRELPCRLNVQPGTWFARDNVFNFILFCRKLGVMECIMFETEDLVCRKNEKHVILTLLEVARRGAKLGMLAPMLVQFEQEIDREIAREERQKRKEEEKRKRDEKRDEERKLAELKRRNREMELEAKAAADKAAAAAAAQAAATAALFNNHNGEVFDSMQVEFDADDCDLNLADVEDLVGHHDLGDDDLGLEDLDDDLEEEEEITDDEDEDDDMEGYEYPIGPMPQEVTNDLKSLDEMVREIVSECQCPTQFPMIRVSEGKYRIGDTQTLIFVRILRNHVMVRVGGGWDTLQHYLDKHDPCRCRAGHKSASHAQITVRNGRNGPVAVGVCYDRNAMIFAFRKSSEPPPMVVPTKYFDWRSDSSSPRRRSSTTNLNNLGRRSSNLAQQANNSASTTTINNKTPIANMHPNTIQASPKNRSSSSQQLPIVNSKARSLYAKQGSANLLLQNSSSSGIPSPNSKLSANKSALAKSVSLQPSGFSSNNSTNNSSSTTSSSSNNSVMVEQQKSTTNKSKDALSTCDSSSEVSDEGYKSSQGNVNNAGTSPNGIRSSTDLSSCNKSCANSSETSSHEGRPESSLTVASECSSTISSEEESNHVAEVKAQQPRMGPSTSSVVEKQSNEVLLLTSKEANTSNLMPIKPPLSPTNSSISSDEEDGGTWHTPTNQTTPVKITEAVPSIIMAGNSNHTGSEAINTTNNIKKVEEKSSSTKNRFSNLFNRFKIKGYSSSTTTVSETPKPEPQPSPKRPAFNRSNSMTSDKGGRGFVRNTTERHSYKAPSATSRYMQAAEAHAAKNRATRSNSNSNGTWSAASTKNSWNNSPRGRSRPALNNDTFKPPSRPNSRTTSASPGPWRRRQFSGDQPGTSEDNTTPGATPPSSVHSTPRRKPPNVSNITENGHHAKKVTKSHKSNKTLADLDLEEEDAILKRMEEILLTYKSRVETHLAAEGRELPKEIFEDFTSQWVAASAASGTTTPGGPLPGHAGHQPLSRSMTSELTPQSITKPPRVVANPAAPSPRKAKRDTSNTRIPMPTFYSNNNNINQS